VEVPQRHPDTPPPGTPMGPHYARCFGCGPEQPHGLQLEVTLGAGVSVEARLTVAEAHQGAPGLAHGGVIAAAFDEALGALLWVVRQPAVTARLTVTYRHPLPVGESLHIVAECLGADRRLIRTKASGWIGDADGVLAAEAEALFAVVPLDHFTTFGRASEWEADHVHLHDRFAESRYNP
jgi:Uncharacterized protein, possibly involved in aromatic compounds catabolism